MKFVNIHPLIMLILFSTLGLHPLTAQVWSLKQCLDTAQMHNKTLDISRNNLAILQHKEKEATANLLPKLTLSGEYKYFSDLAYQLLPLAALNPAAPEGEYRAVQFGVPNNLNANLQLVMPLFNPQINGTIRTTQIASEVSALQMQQTHEEIYFQVSNLYYNAQILYHQKAFLDSNLENATRLLSNLVLLNNQLMAKSTDVSIVRLQVSQLSSQIDELESRYIQVTNALKLVVGISKVQNFSVDPKIEMNSTTEYAKESSTELRLVSVQNKLLTSELDLLNRSRYLPSLQLFATYGTSGFGYSGEPESFLDFYPVGFAGIRLFYPLFNGTVTQRKINQKTFEIKNNQLQRELILEQNNMKLENLKMQRELARKSLAVTSEQITLAQTIYDQLLLQQKQGVAILADVLLADKALREAQQNHLIAIVDYLKADLELKRISGNISILN